MAVWGKITLWDAAADGKVDLVHTRLQQSWTNVNAVDHNGDTAIGLAAKWGHPEVVSVLLSKEADPSIQNACGQSPLHLAADMGQLDCIKVLVEHGVDINLQDLSGFTPLHNAAGKGHTAVCRFLLLSGADKTLKDYQLRTPLQCASSNDTASEL
ncbi:MAG: ankyrin repeat domain-containing protein, partial [archaeon]|nr:ankyrin repeat domain-containing protein [archaeon]